MASRRVILCGLGQGVGVSHEEGGQLSPEYVGLVQIKTLSSVPFTPQSTGFPL